MTLFLLSPTDYWSNSLLTTDFPSEGGLLISDQWPYSLLTTDFWPDILLTTN